MGQNQDMDMESLQKSSGRRGNCLDRCLVVSIVFLFLLVSAVAAGGVVVLMELRSKLDASSHSTAAAFGGAGHRADAANTYKMHNFAYLEATSSRLENCTMSWAPVSYGTGQSVGGNFHFDQQKHSLKSINEGFYFLYVDLNISCSNRCSAGVLTLSLEDQLTQQDKLTCQVQLPANSTHVSQKCWTVVKMKKDSLLVGQMTVPKDGLGYWKLDLKGSDLGMFLVD